MQPEHIVKSRALAGSSDLTLLAPLQSGFVPSIESATYRTRVLRLLRVLSAGRSASHEYALFRPISDAVERVGRIHSVRVAVIDPASPGEPSKVLLAVTFDGPWESYIRVLWQKVGALLDVIFCNTVDYPKAYESTFETWLAWARGVQIETPFFYGTPGITVTDYRYLRRSESLNRDPAVASPTHDAALLTVRSVELEQWDAVTAPLRDSSTRLTEVLRQGMQSLAGLYRLTDLYVPGTPDGPVLLRAAKELLLEFTSLYEAGDLTGLQDISDRFERELRWFETVLTAPKRQLPPAPSTPQPDADVQGGILAPYEGVQHGALVLLSLDGPEAASALLGGLIPGQSNRLTTAADPHELKGAVVSVNAAFTAAGLSVLGLDAATMNAFPGEFLEGMASRAGLIGDLHGNHPRRWQWPRTNWPAPAGAGAAPIDASAVHVVVQLRSAQALANPPPDVTNAAHPLHTRVATLAALHTGIQILAVEPLVRHLNSGKPVEHFGFQDGDGQPLLDAAQAQKLTQYTNNWVPVGEFLLGHANLAGPAPAALQPAWLRNGSFLVVRKLAQDVQALEEAVARGSLHTGIAASDIKAKMMGRRANGDPLAGPGAIPPNDFTYAGDADGQRCPFHAHVRRANPRSPDGSRDEPPGGRRPRIMRRSLSFGPRYDASKPPQDPVNQAPRGLMFMAYNASIGEQFEVVQRWIAGGNSTGVGSAESDPIAGVPKPGARRLFRFFQDGRLHRIHLDGTNDPFGDARPFVRLLWGLYLFAPSISAIGELQVIAEKAAATDKRFSGAPWSAADGAKLLDLLPEGEPAVAGDPGNDAWKAQLEDPLAGERFQSASLLAALRAVGGVRRTPFGVLVTDPDRIAEVLVDPNYSVSGYHQRMTGSIGEIYLGLDDTGPGCPYRMQSTAMNAAIGQITGAEAFDRALTLAREKLGAMIQVAKKNGTATDPMAWELSFELRELSDSVLGALCREWCGLPDGAGELLVAGSVDWSWQANEAPRYPGHFTAPSRYIFQPHPGAEASRFGKQWGDALTKAMTTWVMLERGQSRVPLDPHTRAPARLTKAVFDAFPDRKDDALVARTLVGALMGFLPTVDGNLRASLAEWQRAGTLWSLRSEASGVRLDGSDAAAQALRGTVEARLRDSMHLRPVPEMIWRTAVNDATLGGMPVKRGEPVVLSLVSALHGKLETGQRDLSFVFGGDRTGAAPVPAHACPGYAAAMGVLLGVLGALVEYEGSMRPGAAPLVLTLEGRV